MPLPVHLPTWSQTKTTSKAGFDKVYGYVDKLGAPVNRLSNKLGSEAFWPTTLDKESDKAARILRSFCKDGFYVEEEKENDVPKEGQPKGKAKVIKKIPTEVIKNAKGLAIFTTMRTGLWISGAGGSGVLIAKKDDGEWSPPSGILLHTAGLGFLIGVDIYDCVVVINTQQALDAFTKIRCTLGGEVSATAGPVGMGGVLETELHKRQAPVWNYLKSRGFYAGVQIDGTVIIQRQDENSRFYGEKLEVPEILAGKPRYPSELRTLMMTLKSAQGDTDIDESLLPTAEPTPGDYEVAVDDTKRFGLPPSEDDPDPYGVKALEEEGMIIKEIHESGEKSRPSLEAFEYKPAPSSPIFNAFRADGTFRRHSKRSSRDSGRLSIASMDRGTQTEVALDSPRFVDSPRDSGHHSPVKKELPKETTEDPEEHDDIDENEDFVNSPHEEPVIIEKAKIVTIPRRVPPNLPPRSPYRERTFSPLSPEPEESDLNGLGISSPTASGPRAPPALPPRSNHVASAATSTAMDEATPANEDEAKKDLSSIQLTQSEAAHLDEQLAHIHLSPHGHQKADPTRLIPSRNSTTTTQGESTGDASEVSSNYSHGGGSPPLTGGATPYSNLSPQRTIEEADGVSTMPTVEKDIEEIPPVSIDADTTSAHEQDEKMHTPAPTTTETDEFHSIPTTPTTTAEDKKHTTEHEKEKADDFS